MSDPSESGRSEDELLRLEWSVRGLAQMAELQMTLFPGFVCVADELAVDFDEQWRKFAGRATVFTCEQANAIAALDRKLESMSGPDHAELWTDDALRDSSEWEEVRDLAQLVIETSGWSMSPPPTDRALYVGPDV